MKKSSRVSQFIPLMLLIALMVGIVGGVAAQDGVKVLVTGRQMGASDIPTLDPSLMQDVNSVQAASELFPGLTNVHEETIEVGPGVATWDVSDDGTVYTFHIMADLPWVKYNADSGAVEQVLDESGNPRYVTAGDFAYGITRTLDPAVAGPYQYVLTPWIVGGAEFAASDPAADADTRQTFIDALGIKVIDDLTLELTVPSASSVAPLIFSMWITWAEPSWVIDEQGEFWIEPENINSYGPYALKEWQHGDGGSMTLIKNPFWPGTPNSPQAKIDEVQFVFLDSEPQLANFEAGTIDVAEVPASALDRIKSDPTLSAAYSIFPAGSCTYYYGFNTESAPFDDVRVRRAFSEAIDRQSIVENILKGGQIPASFWTLPAMVAAPSEELYPGQGVYTNLEDAQALWAEYLADTGKQASDFSPTIVYNTNATHEAIATAIQNMWSQAFGVNAQLVVEDFATYLDNRGTFDVFRAGWCFDYPDTNNFLNDGYLSMKDDIHWDNAQYDQLVADGFTAATLEERRDLYAQAEHILVYEEAAIAPIYFYVTQDMTQPWVTRTHSLITREVYEKWDLNK